MMTRANAERPRRRPQQAEKRQEAKQPEERVEDYLTVDPMEIELGVGLIRLADPKRGGDLLDRVQRVRQNVAGEIGIIMPKVRIRDNMRLDAEPVSHQDRRHARWPQGELEPTQLLAIDSGMTTGKVDGIATKDPAFGTDAKWINPGLRGPGRDVRLHGRRAGRRAGDASDRSRAAATPTKSSPATRRSIWSTS